MKKDELLSLGLSDSQAVKILDSLNGNYVTKSRFNELSSELKSLKSALNEKNNTISALKASASDNSELLSQINTLRKVNSEQAAAFNSEISQLKLDYAINSALTAAGAKNLTAVKSLFDSSKLNLLPDGSVDGLEQQLASVKASDPYLFSSNQYPSFKGFQPGASDDIPPSATPDASFMTYSQLAAYLEANPGAEIPE